MTDHADTIRRLTMKHVHGYDRDALLAALASFEAERQQARNTLFAAGELAKRLEAERQQAIDERDEWELIAARTAAGVEDVKKMDIPSRESLLAQNAKLLAERQQAIDALTEIAHTLSCSSPLVTQDIARDALLSLGEQP